MFRLLEKAIIKKLEILINKTILIQPLKMIQVAEISNLQNWAMYRPKLDKNKIVY